MNIADKLTKSIISTIVAACVLVFSVFLFIDNRYFHSANAEGLEVKVVQALENQMKSQQSVSEKQLRLLDTRQLEQLRSSKFLLEKEYERCPDDRYLLEKLDIINRQIKQLEKEIYGIGD